MVWDCPSEGRFATTGKLGDVDLSVKHVGVQAQPEHLLNPYLDCYSNPAQRTINRR